MAIPSSCRGSPSCSTRQRAEHRLITLFAGRFFSKRGTYGWHQRAGLVSSRAFVPYFLFNAWFGFLTVRVDGRPAIDVPPEDSTSTISAKQSQSPPGTPSRRSGGVETACDAGWGVSSRPLLHNAFSFLRDTCFSAQLITLRVTQSQTFTTPLQSTNAATVSHNRRRKHAPQHTQTHTSVRDGRQYEHPPRPQTVVPARARTRRGAAHDAQTLRRQSKDENKIALRDRDSKFVSSLPSSEAGPARLAGLLLLLRGW